MAFFATNAGGCDFDSNAVTIASSSTTSGALDLLSNGFVGFIMPSAFTGNAVTFTGSIDGSNFFALYNADNSAYTVAVAASRYYCLWPADFLGMRYVKIVSNATELGTRTITVITRSFQ